MRRPHILRSVEELRVICRVFRAGGFLECCAMLRAGLVAIRRFGVSVWFAMVRHASLRGDTPYWLTMARYDTPGVRRYASVYVGSGSPVWLVMVRFAGGRGVRRFASPSPMARPGRVARYGAPVALCRALSRAGGSLGCSAMFRLTGSRGPGRLSSGTAAGSAALTSHCFHQAGFFSGNRAAFRVPVPEYAPVRAPLGLQVSRCLSRYTAWCKWRAMARLLSLMHCPTVPP